MLPQSIKNVKGVLIIKFPINIFFLKHTNVLTMLKFHNNKPFKHCIDCRNFYAV